ncbi:hypothetical protein [Budvicia diplopodorum]|uniref:hypothetical protein n=1 Tax=Budvicia diplopodorum TaxID=1119056 RepID=UPI001357CFF6|nr:hypothetical protein [Budvicia diplopodorum]
MATTPTQTHASEDSPFALSYDTTTDFIEQAEYCERLVENLLDSHNPSERLALCGQLSSMLERLQPKLNEPIPPHLIERFTVDSIPTSVPVFEPETELLCSYSLALSQLLAGRTFLPEMEETLNGLLFELVCYFSDELRMPRFVRTPTGVEFIDSLKN